MKRKFLFFIVSRIYARDVKQDFWLDFQNYILNFQDDLTLCSYSKLR